MYELATEVRSFVRRPAALAARALAAALLLAAPFAAAQQAAPEAEKGSLYRDPEDGAFDLTGWLATQTGVLPVISPITEPAVGYGANVMGVLIHGGGMAGFKNAPRGVTGKPVPPSVSVAGGAWTENDTWAGYVAHLGFWGGDRWRYTGALGRVSPKFNVYDAQGRGYLFNLDGWAVYQEMLRRLGRSDFFLGARLVYSDSTARFELGIAPPDTPPLEREVRDSGLGVVAQYDTRNNTFTPSHGVQLTGSALYFGSYLGGDHDFERYTVDGRAWFDLNPRLVLAARLLVHDVGGDPPFYGRPYVRLRGIAAMRYQGVTAVSTEGEVRWALTKRWWLVGFGGAGWTDAGSVRALKDESVQAGGVGFRYLIARLLGLHMGLDVAKGPEDSALYVVFGSAWQ
jgi:hypothetical protein